MTVGGRLFLRSLLAGARLQVGMLRRRPGDLQFFVAVPLFTLIFLSVVNESGRTDLRANAVLGAGLIGLWGISLFLSGKILAGDRSTGMAELLVTAPAGLWPLVCGRVVVVSVFSMVTLIEAWFVAAALGSVAVPAHPGIFALALAATAVAATGTSTVIAALFGIGRDTTIARNSLSYPFYILGGVVVPVALLPDWLRPVTWLCYLSWSSDLLRDAMRPDQIEDVLPRLGAILLLAVMGFSAGRLSLAAVIRSGRASGGLARRSTG